MFTLFCMYVGMKEKEHFCKVINIPVPKCFFYNESCPKHSYLPILLFGDFCFLQGQKRTQTCACPAQMDFTKSVCTVVSRILKQEMLDILE